MLGIMSTITDDPTAPQPSDDGGMGRDQPADHPTSRSLRRSADDRVLAGVAGGLGRYFGVDPVLFRVLFAVSAFFGGAGVLAYVLGWALVPEDGAIDPPVDRLVDELRRRSIGFWVVVGVVMVIFWSAVLQSWQPLGFGPVAIAVVIVAVALSKRSTARATGAAGAAGGPVGGSVGGDAGVASFCGPGVAPTAPTAGQEAYGPRYTVTDPTQAFGPPPEAPDVRRWEAQARIISARTAARESQRSARRERRSRMAIARWGSFGALVATLGVLVVLDATRGIPLSTYGWAMVVVGLVSLVVGGLFRRTPWLNVAWVLVGLSIILTFGTSSASLSDGTGDQLLVPRSEAALPDDVRLAFGRTTLDLTELPAGAARGHTMNIRQAAGLIVVRVPEGMRVAIHAGVHIGAVTVDQVDQVGANQNAGRQFDDGPSAPNVFTIDAHLAVGVIEIDHVTAEEAAAEAANGRESQSGPTTPADTVAPADPVTPPEAVTPPDPVTPDTATGEGTR